MFDGERGQSGGVEVDVLARHEDITMVSPRTSHVMPALTAGGRGGGRGLLLPLLHRRCRNCWTVGRHLDISSGRRRYKMWVDHWPSFRQRRSTRLCLRWVLCHRVKLNSTCWSNMAWILVGFTLSSVLALFCMNTYLMLWLLMPFLIVVIPFITIISAAPHLLPR